MTNSTQMHPLTGASWTDRAEGIAEFSRDWLEAAPPTLGLCDADGVAASAVPLVVERIRPREWARLSGYCFEDGHWLFLLAPEILRQAGIPDNDATVRIFVAGTFNNWRPGLEWEMRRETDATGASAFACPCSVDMREGADFKFVTDGGHWLKIPDLAPNHIRDSAGNHNYHLDPSHTGAHAFRFSAAPEKLASVRRPVRLCFAEYSVPIADAPFLFSRGSTEPMGVTFLNGGSTGATFRIFAPRATAVLLELWPPPGLADAAESGTTDTPRERLALRPCDDGSWEVTHPRAAPGWRYQYRISGENRATGAAFDPAVPVLDPYARAALGPAGPGILTAPAGTVCSLHTPPAPTDAVIVEGHLRDLLGGSPGGFRELAAWLRSPDCYLRRIGANVLELLPVTEYERGTSRDEYRWGYMPVNWFCLASAYASAPEQASHDADLRELVAACHDAGISLVLDVVYNHLGTPNALARADAAYYFAADREGNPTNWSGCGNDLRPESPMARRLVLDSLRRLVLEFGVDGFRFDLAELLGLPLLLEIERELRPLKPGLLLIAEPWSFRGHIRNTLAATSYTAWNDSFRDFLPAYVHNKAGADRLRHHLGGSLDFPVFRPFHSLNYAQSHDDHCWIDRVTENAGNDGSAPTLADARRTRLMHAILLAALGTPMLAAGQDFLHSKHGVANTYQRGDLNALHYPDSVGETANAVSEEPPSLARITHEHARAWIRFRRSPHGAALRIATRPEPGFFQFFTAPAGSNALAALYNADSKLNAPRLLFAVNPSTTEITIPVPVHPLDLSHFRQIANADTLREDGLPAELQQQLSPHSLHLPPLSSALWMEGESCGTKTM